MVLALGLDCSPPDRCEVAEGLRDGELEVNESSVEVFKSLCDEVTRGLNFKSVLIALSAASSTSV